MAADSSRTDAMEEDAKAVNWGELDAMLGVEEGKLCGPQEPLMATRLRDICQGESVEEAFEGSGGELRNRAHPRAKLEEDADDAGSDEMDPSGMPLKFLREIRSDGEDALAAGVEFISDTKDMAQEIFKRVLNDVWKQTHFHHLPDWLKDNDFLHGGHRPQIPSFKECFKSIFRIHSETVNIWTHLLGCISFIAIAAYFLVWKESSPFHEKWVFATFFTGAVLCLGFSFLFHTVYCHSRSVGKLFGKLDYCGISLLILGSFVPWLYFGFYCRSIPKFIYIGVISVLAISAIVVSLWDKFSEPEYRAIRAAVFLALGLSGVIPAVHYVISEGWLKSVQEGSMLWLVFMGVLYVCGAGLYACRVPERWFPGRFDIWFQSHQIFHVLVVIAALVHCHGISLMVDQRISLGECPQLSASSESSTCTAEWTD